MAGPLIAVWSPKGGVGKTLLAVGLGMHLQRRCGEAILVDLDAGKADIAPLLKTSSRPSVVEYAADLGRPVVHPHGLQVVPGPNRLVDSPLVTGEIARSALQRARASTAAVVADLDSDLRDSTIVGLEEASCVLLVTTPDLLSLYACRRFTQDARAVGLNLARFRLVINQAAPTQEIPDTEITGLIGVELAGRVPLLPGLALAINRGMITTAGRSNTEFGMALQRIADRLVFAGLPGYVEWQQSRMAAARPAAEPEAEAQAAEVKTAREDALRTLAAPGLRSRMVGLRVGALDADATDERSPAFTSTRSYEPAPAELRPAARPPEPERPGLLAILKRWWQAL